MSFVVKGLRGLKVARYKRFLTLKVHVIFDDNSSMKSAALKRTSARGPLGFTLIELIVATAILVILTGLAVPLARVAIKREKERELRNDLWELRDAIDRYKDAADRGAFQIKVGTEGYPPDLETLVSGVNVIARGGLGGGRGVAGVNATDVGSELATKKKVYLRGIPIDPMTGQAEWDLLSCYDAPDGGAWGGENVFDVRSKSKETALNGEKYSDW